jgi:hypothetical protein
MSALQSLEERSPISFDLRLVRIEKCFLDPLFRNAAALDLKFGVLVITDHWRR